MSNEEIRARMKTLTSGSIYRDGFFPMTEIATRIGEKCRSRLYRFMNDTEGDRPASRRIYPAMKKRLAELLRKIECGMIQCHIHAEYLNPRKPWFRYNIKKLTYFDKPQKPICALHKINIGPKGVSMKLGSISEKKEMPTFFGAFGGENAFRIPNFKEK
jgi:hypothetical protein